MTIFDLDVRSGKLENFGIQGNKLEILATIPARGGSKGIPKKSTSKTKIYKKVIIMKRNNFKQIMLSFEKVFDLHCFFGSNK